VFLFHLDIPYVAGGFLGVDVFFVISGFLITRILKQEAEVSRLDAVNFYARRVRRLFPALFVVMGFCLLAGIFRYSPERLIELANSGVSAILSVSNFYFYFNNDYFDAAAETQIFLHTWSLAVEEQFYLVWPLIIFLIVKYLSKSWQMRLVIGLCLVGSIASYLGTLIDASMAFYMMPFRITEFGLGALLCWLPGTKLSPRAKELLVLLAVITMLASFSFISDQYLFPGLWFLVPCIATSILIYLGSTSRVSDFLLANPISTYFGKISYSLYLFHWPVIVLYKNEQSAHMMLDNQVAIFMTATLLAITTYHVVEQPLRRPGTIWPTNRKVALNFILGIAVVTFSFRYVDSQDGFPGRVPKEIRIVIQDVETEKSKRFQILKKICRERGWDKCSKSSDSKPNIFILGDSHGIDALNALQPLWPSLHFVMYSENGCPPMTMIDFERGVKKGTRHYEKCLAKTTALSDGSLVEMADMLVISSRYTWYSPEMLDRFLGSLELPADFPIIVFGQAPSFSKDLPEIVYHHQQLAGLDAHVSEFLEEDTWKFEASLREVALSNNATFIAKAGHFCDKNSNQCELFHGNARKLLTYDRNHMSFDSALALGDWISKNSPELPKELVAANMEQRY